MLPDLPRTRARKFSPAQREAAIRWILERLEGGWRLQDACAEPRAPSRQTVHAWTLKDPALRERLARARAWGVQYRPRYHPARFAFDPARAERFLARVRRGESVAAMQAAREAPELAVLRAWRNARPDFDQAYRAAKRAGTEARRGRPLRPFDPAAADRLLARVNAGVPLKRIVREPGMPGRWAVKQWRRARPDFDYALRVLMTGGRRNRDRARAAAFAGPDPKLTRRIGAALAAGATISGLCARPDMPSHDTFYAWRRRFPAFAEEVAEALDHRDWLRAEERE
ncbi:MAG: hypothetical protein GC203_19230 [Phenylobacterium sp.]|uniref:terminase small subunit-like protein n=1 Tax=Phenylobacterium sp. TaxID=1871053 RepID=UPI0025D334D6|nr:hypothetical protein [Phenylobacterium sp.]MBI1199996.1 hypothetical protein [Phenylobacterium sp.]